MSDPGSGEWRSMREAPRDGTAVLAQVRASEQGPAEVDMVRWARPERAAEECWVSADSDPDAAILYQDGELTGWAPLSDPLPQLRSRPMPQTRPASEEVSPTEEIAGSGI